GGGVPRSVRGLVDRYTAADGWWRLDHAQRWSEHAAADCAHDGEIGELLQVCRGRYLAVAGSLQAAFQGVVAAGGWPPEGVRRQTQTFDGRVGPELTDRRQVVYLLVDSLRYEMGRDLAAALGELGAVELEPAAASLPTITPNGMAALLPGAEGTLALSRQGDGLVPTVGGAPVEGLEERKAVFSKRFGDRYRDLKLEDVLQAAPAKLAKLISGADLIVVRSLDLDDLGEGRSYYRARKVMTGVVGELKSAIARLAEAGVETVVVAADHGHVLVPELPAGEVVPAPAGEWLLRKRRSLLGHHRSASPGVVIMPASDAGIESDVAGLELAAATGFKTFREETGYFHEGLSLQECVVPVLTLRVTAGAGSAIGGGEQVTIWYRSDRFTASVVGVRVGLTAMFSPTLVVKIEAYDGAGAKAKRVGEAGDCDARDPVTGEITLQAGEETPVPLVVDPDFGRRSIEVRATDPRTGVVYGLPLKLKNARLD
ncbi:MAG: PglZ domain-containing protein, partial [Chloroflexota bacterium]|nr:PglZ domain-containing protein [Chloroflexota bacterium]